MHFFKQRDAAADRLRIEQERDPAIHLGRHEQQQVLRQHVGHQIAPTLDEARIQHRVVMKAQRWMRALQRDGSVHAHDGVQMAPRIVDLGDRGAAKNQMCVAAYVLRHLRHWQRRRATHADKITRHQPFAAFAAHLHQRPQCLVVPIGPTLCIAVKIAKALGQRTRAKQTGNEGKPGHEWCR
ncbi:hypothetical protein D3C72_1849640 [compost metagenome]